MKNLSIDGINLSFLDINQTSEKTLLFLHGNSHSLKTFNKQIESGVFDQYRLVLLDLPGHGESSQDGSYSLRNITEVLNKFIQELNLEKIVVIGHSLGGHLAINLLKHIKPLGLILFGTPPLKNPFDPSAFLPNANAFAIQQAQSTGLEIENLMKDIGYTGSDLILATQDYLKTDPRFRSEILGEVISGTNENELALIKSFTNDLLILLATNDSLINNNYILNELM
jgi:pimeloyl-ACP methyl ester carboxylesterase